MTELLIVIAPIALIDSMSVTPLGLVPLMSILGGPRPYSTALGLLVGLFVSYLGMGLAFLFGLSGVFQRLNVWLAHRWHHPEPVDFAFELLLGLVLVFFGLKIFDKRQARIRNRKGPDHASFTAAFGVGFMMNVVGFPGAVPFFAAADQIFRADPPLAGVVLAMTFYALVFIAPLSCIVVLRALMGPRGQILMERIKGFFDTWGRRTLFILLLALGLLMVVDAGLYLVRGVPLLPIGFP
jgi:cytochrome c biogenesis protein CcdA